MSRLAVVVGWLDPPVYALGLAEVLRSDPGIEILGADLQGGSLERAVGSHSPQVVILGDGVDDGLVVRVKSHRPAPGVVVLVQRPQRLFTTLLLSSGATCVARDAPAETILSAVRLSQAGAQAYVAANGPGTARDARAVSTLTPRELAVYRYRSEGKSADEIASLLHISANTVKSHTRSVRRKLGVSTVRGLVGLFEVSPASDAG